MRTVVKTTTLSKRWRNLWTTAPCLNFVDDGNPEYFIPRALMFWRGTKILKFKIELCSELHGYSVTDIDSWLRFAKDYEVQELYLHLAVFSGIDEDEELYPVPQYLFYEDEKGYLAFHPSLPNLTRVEVTWGKLDYAKFPLMLKYASNLETMVFRAKPVVFDRPPSPALYSASKKLLKMSRCSPTAKLIICD